mgnify:FL=1
MNNIQAMREVLSDLDLLITSGSKVERFTVVYLKNGEEQFLMPLGEGTHTAEDAKVALEAASKILTDFGYELIRVYYPRFDG